MSDRFSKLFALPENLYSVGSPVVISAGALLKDNQTGKVLVQLKIKNISPKIIKALKVLIVPLDTTNSPLEEPFEYQYLDLDVHRDVEFGQKVPIILPDPHSRGFTVSVNQAIFTDDSIWNAENPTWEPLNKPETIDSHINNTELVKQFHIKYSNQCQYMLSEQKDVWICPCGSLNHSSESTCHKCNNKFSDFKNINWDSLKEEANKRVAEEKAEFEKAKEVAEREAEYRKQREIQVQKRNRRIIYCAVLIIIAFISLKTAIIPGVKYFNAVSLMESGKYEEAVTAFAELGDFADSNLKKDDARYHYALQKIDEEDYIMATEILQQLGDYTDSKDKIEEIKPKYNHQKLLNAEKGDMVVFGTYEQDNNLSNPEGIEWIVLKRNGNELLLISRYCLDKQPINVQKKEVTWATCSLRKWLNDTFYTEAFNELEQKQIIEKKVTNTEGPDTNDRVFLLSVGEYRTYFSSDNERKTELTPYAIKKNEYTPGLDGPWTRTPAESALFFAHLDDDDGKIYYEYGDRVDVDYRSIRPSIWISINE